MANKSILFVDNRPEHLRQPVLRLRLAGYEVDEAASGDDGLAMLQAGSYGLVILDSELPNEDGWDVLRQVRKDPSLADVKVIVFMAAEGETQQLVLVRVDAELRRPFALGALLDAVRKVIGDP
jgi:two-component system, OmpR family, alkaline phosphatase synthesis response regulator PhoP